MIVKIRYPRFDYPEAKGYPTIIYGSSYSSKKFQCSNFVSSKDQRIGFRVSSVH